MKGKISILLSLICINWASAQEYAKILEHTTVVSISGNETAEIEEHYKIRINSDKGKRFSYLVDYTDKYKRITEVSLDILDSEGKKVKKYGRGDALEMGFSNSNEITDAQMFIIDPKYQNYPFVMEVTTKVKYDGFISLPTWNPREQFHLAVDKSTLTIKRPSHVKINLREEHVKGKTFTEDKSLVSQYEVTGLASIDEKMRYRDFFDQQPKVLISPEKFRFADAEGSAATWKAFGNWFYELNDVPFELTDETKAFIKKQGTGDVLSLVRSLYEYMQDRTRYVSIQLGIGGFKSLPTEDVENLGYGDCKALSTYMRNMLSFAGIKSNYILARAGNDVADVIADFPSNQFNHVYLAVPSESDTLYLECTSQISPTDYTGTFTDDRNVLWIEPEKSRIMRSRVYDQTLNQKNSNVTIKLAPEGDASAVFDVTNSGVFFDEVMIYKSGQADYVTRYNEGKFAYGDFTIKSFSFDQPERRTPVFKARYTLAVKGLGRVAGSKLVLPNVPVIPLNKYLVFDDLMKFCSVRRGMTVVDEIEVSIPKDFWAYNLPAPEEISSRFGNYTLTTSFDGEKLKIKRVIVLYKGEYTKEEYDTFKAFHQKLERVETRKLVFNSKT